MMFPPPLFCIVLFPFTQFFGRNPSRASSPHLQSFPWTALFAFSNGCRFPRNGFFPVCLVTSAFFLPGDPSCPPCISFVPLSSPSSSLMILHDLSRFTALIIKCGNFNFSPELPDVITGQLFLVIMMTLRVHFVTALEFAVPLIHGPPQSIRVSIPTSGFPSYTISDYACLQFFRLFLPPGPLYYLTPSERAPPSVRGSSQVANVRSFPFFLKDRASLPIRPFFLC